MVSNQRILVVDDQPFVRTALRTMLEDGGGNELFDVSNAYGALQFLRGVLPNLIICDISMENGDGFGLLSKLRSGSHKLFDVPVIFLTSHSEPQMVRKAAELGVDGYLLKPVGAARLKEVIEKALAKRGQRTALRNLRVLLVDDQSMVRVAVRTILNGLGCTYISEAADGEEAFQVMQEALPTLIISDIQMPDGDGFTFLRNLRSGTHSLFNFPVIFLTSNSLPEYVKTAAQMGVDGYLLKPVSADKLHSKIEEVLKVRQGKPTECRA